MKIKGQRAKLLDHKVKFLGNLEFRLSVLHPIAKFYNSNNLLRRHLISPHMHNTNSSMGTAKPHNEPVY